VTFAQMIIEFKARGFNHLGSRTESYLNDAYLLDICEEEDWPFLEDVAEGPAPLEISDLRTVQYVIDSRAGKLDPLLRSRITDDWNPDLTQTGTPSLYYVTKGTTINVFPVATNEVVVNYWKVPPELSASAEPLMPKRWHSLIIDGAVARAYANSDDYELAQASRNEFSARLQLMRDSLLHPQHDSSDDYIAVEDPAALH
jgi:hypothetical protein